MIRRAFSKIFPVFSFCCLAATLAAQNRSGFPVVASGQAAPFVTDSGDAAVVAIAAQAVAGDLGRITGTTPGVIHALPAHAAHLILLGTLGHSTAIDTLRRAGKLDTHAIEGQWESYMIVRVAKPFPGIEDALVIAGADRRGTAYGAFALSRRFGVSPWVWWADVTPPHAAELIWTGDAPLVQRSPSVKYRGIFLNDEDWGLRPWASKTYDPATGGIGPKTYGRVFELLLRLRANTLWPAMHFGTNAFNQYAEDAPLADRYAIVMGSSHAEPMLRDLIAEWDPAFRGPYDFQTNSKNVLAFWRERVQSNAPYENLWTLGMRGIQDAGMSATGDVHTRAALLDTIIADQRALLRQYVKPDPAQVPQVFIPYKEVLELYRAGMHLPADITLGWVDDNYSYIRQLSTEAEQQRSGGAGVYYHISYWGSPQDYLWVCSTPPALILEQMSRAWQTSARTMWILNIGDIKPGELDTEYFLDLAYDFNANAHLTEQAWLERWAAKTFAPAPAAEIASILIAYYHLGFARKPEHMGFNVDDGGEQPTLFSPVNYGDEGGQRIAAYEALDGRAQAVYEALPPDRRDAFYETVLYPLRGSRLASEKYLFADRSLLYAAQGRASASLWAARAAEAFQQIQAETAHYNDIAGGKWRLIMSDQPRELATFQMPATGESPAHPTAGIGVAPEGSVAAWTERPVTPARDYQGEIARWRSARKPDEAGRLPAFTEATAQTHFFDVFALAPQPQTFTLQPSAAWIVLSSAGGSTAAEQRVRVSIDWSKAPAGDSLEGSVLVQGASASHRLNVFAQRASTPAPGTFVEQDGVVSMRAEHANHLASGTDASFALLPGLGRSGDDLSLEPTDGRIDPHSRQLNGALPSAEFDFDTLTAAPATAIVSVLPAYPLDTQHRLRFSLTVDHGEEAVVDIDTFRKFAHDVLANTIDTKTRLPILTPGHHTLRLRALDQGLVVEKIVLDLGGLRQSYLGPAETRVPDRAP